MRHFAACIALAGGLWIITTSVTAETPALPADSYKKAAEADVQFLQTRLADLAKKQAAGDPLVPGHVRPALGVALLLAAYGDALGDTVLKADAIKIAEAIEKKEFKNADMMAKKLAVKPGKPGQPGALPKPFKDELMLEAVMNPFRLGKLGGLNIEKDIRDMTKGNNPIKIDPAAVEVLAVRTAVINAYAFHHPNLESRKTAASKKQWETWSTESIDLSKQLTAEAAKGKTADEMKLKMLLTNLNNTCNHCHEKFRDLE